MTSTAWRKYEGVRLAEALGEFRRESEDAQQRTWIERFSAHGSFLSTDLSNGRTVTSLGWRVTELQFATLDDRRVRLTAYADPKQPPVGANAEIAFELYLRDKQSPDAAGATHRVAHLMLYTQPVLARAGETAGTTEPVRLNAGRPIASARQTQWNLAETSLRSIDSNDERIEGTLLEVIVGMRRDIVWTLVAAGSGGYRVAKLEFDLDRHCLDPLEGPPPLDVTFVVERQGRRVVLADDETAFETVLAPGADAFHPAVHMKLRLAELEPVDGAKFALSMAHRGTDVLRFEVDGHALEQASRADPVRRKLRVAVVTPRDNAPASSVWDIFDGRLESVEVGFHSVEAMWLLLPRERRPRDNASCPRAAVFGDIRKL